MEALRKDGHDVVWVRTEAPGIDDVAVLAKAQLENRIVITFDKDFGELAFRSRVHAVSRVILFRTAPRSSEFVADLAVRIFRTRSDWAGHFSVIHENRIRMILLPGLGHEEV